MKTERIQEIIDAYFPKSEYDEKTRRDARMACENIERETRQENAAKAYELANFIANNRS